MRFGFCDANCARTILDSQERKTPVDWQRSNGVDRQTIRGGIIRDCKLAFWTQSKLTDTSIGSDRGT
jgi:hypothetical protein